MSEHIYSATMDNGGSIKVYIWGLLITASNQVLGYSPMWTREGACNFFLNDQNNSDLDELGFNLTHIEGEPIATFKLNEGDNQVKVKVELEVDINLLNQYLGKSKGVSIPRTREYGRQRPTGSTMGGANPAGWPIDVPTVFDNYTKQVGETVGYIAHRRQCTIYASHRDTNK